MQDLELRNNGFAEISTEESMEIDGGLGVVGGIVAGYIAGVVVDGTVKAATGKSTADWIATGINKLKSALS